MDNVYYRWSPKGNPDLCSRIVLTEDVVRLCYHCGRLIPAGEPRTVLKTMRDETFFLHASCTKESCSAADRGEIL